MDSATSVIFILLTVSALSYSWGMRGLVVGGEKGAMLPGAFLGLLLAWFSGSQVIRENFWIFAAAGALAMFFGGSEPYGQTLGFVVDPGSYPGGQLKGYTGVALKGAIWFGLCATLLGLSFSAAAGMYKWYDIVIMTALMPAAQAVGVKVFNSPFDKNSGTVPSIYFSVDRREEWGGNLVTILLVLTFVCLRSDALALILGFAGALSGALGWVFALWLYRISSLPFKNGKYLFGPLARLGMVDGWKIMEFALGASAGLGISLAYCLKFEHVLQRTEIIEKSGIWSPIHAFEPWISIAACTVVMLCALQYVIAYVKTKSTQGTVFGDSHVLDLIERPMYYLLPLMAVLLGSTTVSKFVSGFVVLWVGVEKTVFGGRLEESRHKNVIRYALLFICALLLAVQILIGGWNLITTWLLYGLPYLALELLRALGSEKRERLIKASSVGEKASVLGSVATVYPFFLFLIVSLAVAGVLIFC